MSKGFPGGLAIKKSACNAGDMRDEGLIPGSIKSLGGGNDHPFHYSCLENPTDRGTEQTTVQHVVKQQATTKQTEPTKSKSSQESIFLGVLLSSL